MYILLMVLGVYCVISLHIYTMRRVIYFEIFYSFCMLYAVTELLQWLCHDDALKCSYHVVAHFHEI